MRRAGRIALVVIALALASCAAQQAFRDGQALIDAGDVDQGLAKVEEAIRLDPSQQEYRMYLRRRREIAVQRLMAQGESSRLQAQWDSAEAAYRKAASIDPSDPRPARASEFLRKERQHQAMLREAEVAFKAGQLPVALETTRKVLAENPNQGEALALLRQIEEKTVSAGHAPRLSADLQRSISLEFRDTQLRAVFELISRNTGINFFFDKDMRPDLRTTIFVRNTSIEDVLRFILVTNQLERKVLSHNSLLIYPNTPAKLKEYQELITKSFYLAHADVKQTANLIRNLVKTKDLFIDEKLKLLIIRDTPDAVRMAEKLVAAHDLAESEVMLELEVMEVASSLLNELGIRYPDQVNFSIVGAGGIPGTITLQEWLNRSSALYRLTVPTPLLQVNLKEQDGRANLLANPRVRVKDGQKARVHIGDKVPVITTTLTAQSFASESVSYLDVGLKLDVEPSISLKNEVGIKVGLEVSNIVQEIKSANGTTTYRLGTRNAATTLQLKDGETQVLAGLISDEDRKSSDQIPGLGRIPVVGRLFSSQKDTTTKTEIVLLITPRILRNLTRPDAQIAEFMSGTESAIGSPPLVFRTFDSPTAAVPAAQPQGTAPKPISQAVPAPATVARLSLKAPGQIKLGQQFTMVIDLTAETSLRAGTLEFAYDRNRLQVVKVEEGELLKKAGKDSSFRYNVQEDAGRFSVSYAVSGELKGSGELMVVTFVASELHPGTTIVRMETPSALDPAGKSVALASPTPIALSVAR